ncbi:MAG: response regulator [Candidatus Yonathbacteria bacterium]|nr:response regulator [Candidatus Yonathbacteria bacterium]
MKQILVVEDEEAISRALVDWLSLSPKEYKVELAENGREAIEKVSAQKFDLILLDLVLPDIDGFGVLAALKERNIETKVIVLTNLDQPEDIKRVSDLGVPYLNLFVKNETKLSMLSKKIEEIFASE